MHRSPSQWNPFSTFELGTLCFGLTFHRGNIKSRSNSGRRAAQDSTRQEKREAGKEMTNIEAGVEDHIILPSNQAKARRYWDSRFLATNGILLLMAAVAAYLEYSVYPVIITQTYGETNPSLVLSFLTFRWNATNCRNVPCVRLQGLPALDFFQIFILALVFVNLLHFLGYRMSLQAQTPSK